MSTLESIVLPLPESRALAAAGIVLDTALVWVYVKDANGRIVLTVMSRRDAAAACLGADCDGQKVICGAPVLSEIVDTIRAKVGKPVDETTVILNRDGDKAGANWVGVRKKDAEYEIAQAPTDLLAAASLLLEVSR